MHNRIRLIKLMGMALLLIGFGGVQAQPDITRLLPIETNSAFNLAIAPDGMTAAIYELGIYHRDEIVPALLPIRLIDLMSGDQIEILIGASDYARAIAFAPDGRTLASYHANGYINLWDVASGDRLRQIPASIGGSQIGYLPDGSRIVLLNQNQLELWDPVTGHLTNLLTIRYNSLFELREALDGARSDTLVAFAASADSAAMATADFAGAVRLWDVEDGSHVLLRAAEEPRLPRVPIRDLLFTPEGDTLIYYNVETNAIETTDLRRNTKTLVTPVTSEGNRARTFVSIAPEAIGFAWAEESDDEVTTIHISTTARPDSAYTETVDLPDGVRLFPDWPPVFSPDGFRVVYIFGSFRRDLEDSVGGALLVLERG
ncbi:MAG: WD40 repeat domain-containing protein [Chloroflexi bacterium]|nr:WD40 repeat domain-containing protein [Chloroflexota bacterium]